MGKGKGRVVPDKPDKTFRSCVFLRLEFIENEILERFGLQWCSELSLSDFLPFVNAIY